MHEKQPASAPSAVRFETGKIIEWRAAIQPSICLFNRLSSNRVQAAFYALCGKSWRNSHLLPLPWERVGVGTLWVLTHFGAGGGFGVGMAAIRHVLPLKLPCPFLRARESGGYACKRMREQNCRRIGSAGCFSGFRLSKTAVLSGCPPLKCSLHIMLHA